MSARIVPYRTSLVTLFKEILFTTSQMEVEPLAASYLPVFQGHRTKWQDVFLQEIAIVEALMKAQAAVVRADKGLDRFVIKVMNAVDENTAGATQKLILKKLLKGKTRAKFVRRVLAGQLLEMKDWSDTLAGCGIPALVALAPEAAALWDVGNKASEARAKARSVNRDFRDIGARKQFIDEVNASRKEVDGALAKLPFQNPTLPQDFNEIFWMVGEQFSEDEETIDDVQAAIDDLNEQLAKRMAQHAQMKQDAQAEAALAEQRQANDTKAADLRAQAAKLLAEAEALESDPNK